MSIKLLVHSINFVSYDIKSTKRMQNYNQEEYTLTSDFKAVDTMTISEKIGNGSFVVKG